MCKICPKCGAIAEYNAYYGRVICTTCSWQSEKSNRYILRVQDKPKSFTDRPQTDLVKVKA